MNCIHPSKGFVLFDNVVLHVLILFVLLSALFIFFIVKLTSEGFNHEFTNIVDQIVNPGELKEIIKKKNDITIEQLGKYLKLKNILDPKVIIQLTALREYLKNLKPEQLESFKSGFTKLSNNYASTEDPLRKETNYGVKTQIIIVIFFLVLISIIINVLSRKFGNCGVLKHLGLELFIVFAFIGAIEFWFFTNVAKKYVPVHVDVMVKTFKERMTEIINGK